MPWARIFFVYGRAAMDRPQMVVGQRGSRGQSNIEGTTRERRAEKEKKDVFLFLGERLGDAFLTFWVATAAGAQLLRPWRYRHRRENGAGGLRHRGGKNPACRGLIPWRPAATGPSLSSLYTLDTYAEA